MNRNTSVLLAILLIGLAVRGIGITSESLWCDEISSLNHIEQDFPAFFDSLLNVDVHPPLYFVLLRGWCRLFGSTALSARLLSLVLGLLCLPAAFSLGRRLLDERAGLMAALFLALSPIHVFYAQEARAYTLLALLVLLAVASLIDALENDRPRDWALLVIWNTALLYTHYTALAFILCEAAAAVISRPSRAAHAKLALSLLLSALLFAPWAGPFLAQAGRFRSAAPYQTWGAAAPADLVRVVKELLYGKEAVVLYLILAFGPLAAPTPESLRKLSQPLLWALGPLFLLAAFSLIIAPMLAGRFLLGALPFFFLIAAAGTIGLAGRIAGPGLDAWRARAFVALIVLLVVTINGKYLYNQLRRPDRVDLRPVVRHLEAAADSEALVVVIPDHHLPVLRHYLRSARSSGGLRQAIAVFRSTPVRDLRERLDRELWPGREIILVYCASEAPEAKVLQDYFEQRFRRIGRETFERIDVFRYVD